MAQSGYTPIQLYYSSTTTNVPLAANLAAGELAINTADGKLFYKDSGGAVQVLGTKGGVGSSSTTQVLYNSSGLVAGSANMTFNGTTLALNSASISNTQNFSSISAPSYSKGLVWYDTDNEALAYYNDATNNAVHIGQETVIKVKNATGSTIAAGVPVYITSTSSGSTYPNVAPAKADATSTAAVIGITNTAITAGSTGYAVAAGMVSGVSTGAFTVGDVLYLSPYSAGQLMNTVPPTGYAVQIGVVSYANSPNGWIYTKQTTPLAISANTLVGTVPVANGGTNLASYTIGDVLYASGTTTLSKLGIGTSGYVLTSNGTAPTWAAASSVSVTTISFGSTGLTPSTATGGAVTVAGTLALANGGTGATTVSAAQTNLQVDPAGTAIAMAIALG